MDTDIILQHLSSSAQSTAGKAAGQPDDAKELKAACQGFEAIFLQTLLKSMRQTLPGDSLLDSSHGQSIYRSMHDQYLAEQLSKGNSSTGLAAFLYEQLKNDL